MHIAHMHSALYYVNFGCIALPWVASLDGPSYPSGSPSLNVLPIVIAVYLFAKNKLSLSIRYQPRCTLWQMRIIKYARYNPNPNPYPTAKQLGTVGIQLNIVTCHTYPEKFIPENVVNCTVCTNFSCHRHTARKRRFTESNSETNRGQPTPPPPLNPPLWWSAQSSSCFRT